MKTVKFTNAMGHEQILNLEMVSSIEKYGAQSTLLLHYGKDHVHINLKSTEIRDQLFEEILKLLGLS